MLPDDFVKRMFSALQSNQADISVADSGERIQPVFSLLKCSLLDSLLTYLDSGERKIDRWFQQHVLTKVDFSDKPETFININTPEDIKNMEARQNS
jgi:molybdopterin-guanine dinucleotide biosynthesis protein A